MSNLNLFKDEWESYALAVLPEDASGEQIVETRRAFYAGGTSLLLAVLTDIVGPDDKVDEAAVGALDSVHQEFVAFAMAVENGEA